LWVAASAATQDPQNDNRLQPLKFLFVRLPRSLSGPLASTSEPRRAFASDTSSASASNKRKVHRRTPLRRVLSLPNMAAMNYRGNFRCRRPRDAASAFVQMSSRLALGPCDAASWPLAPGRSRRFYSTMNPNRNRRNPMKTKGRCAFYSTLSRGGRQTPFEHQNLLAQPGKRPVRP